MSLNPSTTEESKSTINVESTTSSTPPITASTSSNSRSTTIPINKYSFKRHFSGKQNAMRLMYGNNADSNTLSQLQMDSSDLELLPKASDLETKAAPKPSHGVIEIATYIMITKIREIDAKASSVNGSFVVHLLWKNTNLIGKRVKDEKELWCPRIQLINRDRIIEKTEGPRFYPTTGDIRQEIHFDGSFGNEADLRHFPFDMDSISLLLVAERGTADELVRLSWQKGTNKTNSHSAASVTPAYIARQMQEWTFFPNLNSVRRMRQQPGISGDATGIELRIYLARKWQFYVYKIASVIYMITALSWFSLSFNVDDGVINLEAVAGRLSYASSLLLASVAFLYISAESIPKLPYLTTLDQMILYGFLNLFLVMTETYIAFRMSKSWSSPEWVIALDTHAGWFLPVLYITNQFLVIRSAFLSRKKCYDGALSELVGVEACLVGSREEEMKKRQWWHQNSVDVFDDQDDKK